MAHFHLHILGTPRVTESAGSETVLPAGKPLALLALIALDPSGITRDDAASLLWPASTHDRARASVRQALWTLRKNLDAEAVSESDDDRLTVDEGLLTTDLDEMAEAMARADGERVAELWSGGPFRGFVVADAPGWNQWAAELHTRWETRVGDFLEDYAAGQPVDGRLQWIDRALEIRPYRTSLHEMRIRTLLELGWLDESRDALAEAREHYGGEAEEELATLESAVDMAVRGRYGGGKPDPLAIAFVGRGPEFAALSDVLRSVRAGKSRSVGIIGPPGIGKTRLAREFCNVARASDAAVVEVRGVPGERSVEYGVAADLIRQLLSLPGAAGISNASADALRSLVPSRGNGSLGSGSPPAAVAVGDAFADLVDAVAEESPLVMMVDDLHWVDPASRILVHRVMRLVRDRPVLLVETCRTEMGEDSVLRFLRAETEAGRVQLLPLAPLDVESVTELLTQLAVFRSEEDAGEAGVALFRASRGHPLHLVALLRSLRASGVMEEREGEWVFHLRLLPAAVEMPSELQELLANRLTEISDDAREVLAALGRRNGGEGLPALRRASGLPEERFALAVSELFAGDLIGWSGGEEVDFSHDLLRDAVRRSGGRPSTVRRSRPVALGAVAVVAVALLWVLLPREEPSPWEGTLLQTRVDGAVLRYEPRPGGGWALRDSIPIPGVEEGTFIANSVVARPVAGLIGNLRPQDRGPDVAVVDTEGTLHVLYDGGGDDGVRDVSPDGRSALIAVEDTGAATYRNHLFLLELDTGSAHQLLDSDHLALGTWSGSGRLIHAGRATLSGPDQLFLLRPDGSVHASATLPQGYLGMVRNCGEDRTLVHFQQPAATDAWTQWDWTSGSLRELPPEVARAADVVCSPDGDAWVVRPAQRPDELRVLDGATLEERTTLPLAPGSGVLEMRWVHEEVSVPAEVVAAGPDVLPWGGVAAVRATVMDQEGRPWEGEVTWRTLDPAVVGIRGDSVVGNRPGLARVVAVVDGWLMDTLETRVSATATAELLLLEEFRVPLGADWHLVGTPKPRVVQFQGEPVLDTGGDAVWRDGVESREAVSGEQGLTAEVEFRLPLTDRLDRQSIRVCLLDEAIPVDTLGTRPVIGLHYCVLYPQGELSRFDASALSIEGSPSNRVVPGFPAPGLGTEEWAALGLQVQPDGRLSAVLNGREVGVYPEPVRFDGSRRYRLAIYGRAQETTLYLRRATVWRGARY